MYQPLSSVQFSGSVVSDSATLRTEAHQASLSLTNSWSLLKFMSTESSNASQPSLPSPKSRKTLVFSHENQLAKDSIKIQGKTKVDNAETLILANFPETQAPKSTLTFYLDSTISQDLLRNSECHVVSASRKTAFSTDCLSFKTVTRNSLTGAAVSALKASLHKRQHSAAHLFWTASTNCPLWGSDWAELVAL